MVYFDELVKVLSPLSRVAPTDESIAKIFEDILEGTTRINQTFTQSRQRVHEFAQAIADTTPLVNKLGGTSTDTVNLIDIVARTTKRNIVASGEEISKLFAASKLSNIEAKELIENFQNIGVQFSQIGNSMQKSIGYIQSIGANARDILAGMKDNIGFVNQFDFKDGVLGLTRMATQAQLLKFDMKTTMGFAEKVLSPEKAIEMSSAFQRLGVSVGTLTDPFQLMNKALTDPEGLQQSIVEMTKQFTYFDEKANQFKINPQGMLMLREIGREIEIDSKELSKMALNASELDRRLSMISPSFEFENEEDRQYIANIAKMGTDGKYTVTLTDEKDPSKNRTVELQNANNEELKELVRIQKAKGEVTLEGLQQQQLDQLTKIYGVIAAGQNTFFGGIASSKVITDFLSTGKVSDRLIDVLDNFSKEKIGTTSGVREKTNEKIQDIKPFVQLLMGETKELFNTLKPFIENVFSKVSELIQKIPGKLLEGIEAFETRTGANFPDIIEGALRGSGASNDMNGRRPQTPFRNYGTPERNDMAIPTNYTGSQMLPDTKEDFNVYRASFKQTKINKVEFGELPVFRVLFSKDSNFDVPTDAIMEAFQKPEVMRGFVQAMIPYIKEYQPTKETSYKNEI